MERSIDHDRPLVSVIVPCYNRAHMIARTIRSIQDQTYKNLEILLIDDGSQDNLAEVVSRIHDSRLRLIRQDNLGATRARNRGIDEAAGDFVAFLDSDDTFLPDHLTSSVDLLRTTHGNVVVYAPVLVDRGAGRRFLKPPRALGRNEHMADYLLRDRGFVQTSTVVMPVTLARKVRYQDDLPFGQDLDFAIRLYAAGARFHMMTAPGAVWLDIADPHRISHRSVASIREQWLDSIRSHVPAKAYYGGRGWYAAKAYRQQGNVVMALKCYLEALFLGCYDAKLAVMLSMQIFMPQRVYRHLVNAYVGIKKERSRA